MGSMEERLLQAGTYALRRLESDSLAFLFIYNN